MERIHFTIDSVNGDTGIATCTMATIGNAPLLGQSVAISDPTGCMLTGAVPGLNGCADLISGEWVITVLQCPPEV